MEEIQSPEKALFPQEALKGWALLCKHLQNCNWKHHLSQHDSLGWQLYETGQKGLGAVKTGEGILGSPLPNLYADFFPRAINSITSLHRQQSFKAWHVYACVFEACTGQLHFTKIYLILLFKLSPYCVYFPVFVLNTFWFSAENYHSVSLSDCIITCFNM